MSAAYEMIVTTGSCPWCDKAKALLTEKGLEFRIVPLDTPERKASFIAAGHKTVPQIYHNDNHVGGFTELEKYLA